LGGITPRAVLTAAEQSVATLAAAGHANKTIAEELVLSLRTGGELSAPGLRKLGISGRAELAAALKDPAH
jgi:DNA-binding NarL/FixJ family response regulator